MLRIRKMLEHDRLSHAYLFHGAPGAPKQAAAKYLIHSLFCDNKVMGGCQTCAACRQVIKHNHPSLLWVVAEEFSFKIEQAREIQQAMNYLSVAGKYRVAVLEEAEKLTPEASNSLLKFLEEPEENLIVILIVEELEKVLPTIRSRCQQMLFALPPVIEVQNELIARGIDSGEAEQMAMVWQELPLILSLHERDKFAIMYQIVVQLSADLIKNSYSYVNVLNQKWFTKKDNEKPTQRENEALVDFMIEWFYEWLMLSNGYKSTSILITEQYRTQFNQQLSTIKLQLIVTRLMELRAGMAKKYNTQLLLEATLLKIQGELMCTG